MHRARIVIPLTMIVLGSAGCEMTSADPAARPIDSDTDHVQLESVFPDLTFSRPVDLQSAPGRPNELFVVEQAGIVRSFVNDPATDNSTEFLDIRGRVRDRGNEEGLLGLAFHPDFDNNGYFFVDYTASSPRRTVIARYKLDDQDPALADPSSETVILEVEQPFGNHNGGQIAFGPDGFLYIALGDGGSAGDPQEHGQNLGTLLGSLLRIDVDDNEGGRTYGIPPSNPFVGVQGARGEIFAYGLRNPWRFSFDLETNRIWAGDVGQDNIEEIDIIEAGKNYGWNTMEGTRCFDPSSGCDQTGLVLPVTEYGRALGISVTGGYVYRGDDIPSLQGDYIFADYGTGRIWALEETFSGQFDRREIFDTPLSISSFGTDAQNELYVCAFDGKIYKFEPEPPEE